MDLIGATIAIAFVPLLEKICGVLGVDKPTYRQPAAWLNIVEVLVQSKGTQTYHIFSGNDCATLQASAESAAMKAAVFLVQRFKVMVLDVNLELRSQHERAYQFFSYKRDWFANLDRDIYQVPNYEFTPTEGIDYSLYRVDLDFIELLTSIVQHYGIPVTPIDVMQLRQGVYVAGMKVSLPGSVCMERSFTGYETEAIDAAKQNLAKQVISFLTSIYRFEVRDVNYHFLKGQAAILKAERNNYIRIKERVYGLKEDQEPVPDIIQQDQITPKGKRSRLDSPTEAPPLAKKSCHHSVTISGQTLIADSVITPDLKFPERRPARE